MGIMRIKIKKKMCNHIECVSDGGENCYRLPFAIDGNDVIKIIHAENGDIVELSIGIIRTCEYVPSVWFTPPNDDGEWLLGSFGTSSDDPECGPLDPVAPVPEI